MRIVYSYNKKDEEADFWQREIAAASNDRYEFIPFNHGVFLSPWRYIRAQLLDNLYYDEDPDLFRMYQALQDAIASHKPEVLLVDTCQPYHPEFLLRLRIHKALRIADGPLSAYDRDFAYLHAFDQILYHSPGYSRDLDMLAKLRYCGATNIAFWPFGLFDRMHDTTQTEATILQHERDIDVIFIGATHPNKMPLITRVKKAFGRRCVLHGLTSWKRNLYFAWKYRFPHWIMPVAVSDYVKYYQRAKIGFNVHNRGKYTLGGFRFYELPGNGVMQISDGDEYLPHFYDVGNEIVAYSDVDDLIDKIRYYLANEEERNRIAVNGYGRVMRDYRMGHLLRILGGLLEQGIGIKTSLR
ncbi:MAG TPA: glycosyltransferase [Sedimentisphaerales bacterium]|nr:glycosyltransferase [Sedimentisphaerales bacterium]